MTTSPTTVSTEVDLLDRRIIHAVQLDPRASFAHIGAVLRVSEQTVARRLRRMEGTGLIRVLGLTSPEVTGHERWLLRIRCRPDAAARLGEALARRHDVSWVSLAAGGAEIICQARTRRDPDGQDLLLQRLPRTAEVIGLNAFSVLHEFDVDVEWSGYGGDLAPDQIAQLAASRVPGSRVPASRVPASTPSGAAARIEPTDEPLLAALARDGRTSLRRLGQQTGWSTGRVARRVQALGDCGALYFDVDLDVARLGFATTAMLWLGVAPNALSDVGRALGRHDEVAYCAAVTGRASLVASVVCRNPGDLYRYLTTQIAALPAITQVETTPMLRRIKQAGSILTDAGIARAPLPKDG